jgi:hypothetical protein
MSFDDRLRTTFQRIDASLDREGLDWATTIHRARRSRRLHLAAVTGATAILIGGGALAAPAVLSGGQNPRPVAPAHGGSTSPTPSPTPTATAECSGARDYGSSGFEGATDSGELPKAVLDEAKAIVEAARTCDYQELERLAGVHSGAGFNYSFGGGDSPASYWRHLEEAKDPSRREEVTSIMITLLNMRHAVDCMSASMSCAPGDEDLYIWPRVAGPNPAGKGAVWNRTGSDADWQELVDAGLYSQQEVDQMRKSGTGYTGYRIGIRKDGDWLYFVGGD